MTQNYVESPVVCPCCYKFGSAKCGTVIGNYTRYHKNVQDYVLPPYVHKYAIFKKKK